MAEFSGRLSKAPLIYALCQIRFSPVLKMSDLVADIQEKLRVRYDGFQEENVTGIQMPAKGQPVVQAETRWRFERSDRRAGYILHNSSLVFHTTAYSDFEEFVPEVIYGFDIVTAVAKIQNVQRIGLRYIDLIEGDEKNAAEIFLHPQLRGFGAELQGVAEHISQYVFNGSTSIGQLLLRATHGRHEIPLPPDLLPLTLKAARPSNTSRPSFFLDTDHFIDRSDSPLPVSEVQKIIRDLKVPISAAFKAAITNDAVTAWK